MKARKPPYEVWYEVLAEAGVKVIPVGHQRPTDLDIQRQWALADKAIARMGKEGRLKPSRNGKRKATSASRRRPR